MAKIIYTLPASELIGSIGGTTYQSNRSGYIARQKSFNKRKRSQPQLYNMNKFSNLSQYYRDLSAPNKSTWDAFSLAHSHTTLWGDVRTLSGLQWFISINSNLILVGSAITDIAPVYLLPPASNAFNVLYASLDLSLATAGGFGPVGLFVVIFASSPVSSVASNPRKLFRFIPQIMIANTGGANICLAWQTAHKLNFDNSVFNPGNIVRVAASIIEPTSGLASPFVFNT